MKLSFLSWYSEIWVIKFEANKKRKQRKVAGHMSILVFLAEFFIKDIPEAAVEAAKRCSAK